MKTNAVRRSIRRGVTKGGKLKTLDKVLTVIAWVIAGIIFWALAPFLLELLNMADHVHKLFNK